MDGFDGYVRVSRVGGRSGESFISPDEQERAFRGWAAMRGETILAVHVDLDQSGGKMDRPALEDAIQRVERGESSGIVVAKLDRFARTLPGALEVIARIDRAGGQIVSVAEGLDPTTPVGKLMLRLVLSIAEWQLDVTRESWATARRRAVERGVHVASRTPTGYERDDGGRLIPHPTFGPAVRDVFARKAGGASWRDLTDLLDQRAVVGPYGASQWTTRAVSHIIANRVYLGEARSGEFVNRTAHEPLVDRQTWEAAQRTEALPAVRGAAPAVLSGLMRCAGCRHLMKPDHQRMRDGRKARIYRCRGHHAAGTCPSRAMVLGSIVEPWIDEQVRAHLADEEPIRGASEQASDDELDALLVEIERAEQDLDAFRDDERILGALGAARYVEGLQTRARRVDDLHAQAAVLRAATAGSGLLVAGLLAAWDDLTVEERQRVYRGAVGAVMLRSVGQANVPIASRALILWRGEVPDDFPARGRRQPFEPFTWGDDAP